jgi:hypothetical protein
MTTYRRDFMERADTVVVLRGSESPFCGPGGDMAGFVESGNGAAA